MPIIIRCTLYDNGYFYMPKNILEHLIQFCRTKAAVLFQGSFSSFPRQYISHYSTPRINCDFQIPHELQGFYSYHWGNKLFLGLCDLWHSSLCFFWVVLSPTLSRMNMHELISTQLKTRRILCRSTDLSLSSSLSLSLFGCVSLTLSPLNYSAI